MPWRFGSYLSYCDQGAEQDEMPLYMFDKVGGAVWKPSKLNTYNIESTINNFDLCMARLIIFVIPPIFVIINMKS